MNRLIEFAEQNASKFPATGYKVKNINWTVTVEQDGSLSFVKLAKGDQEVIPDVTRASGIKPILLTDKAEYVFGLSKPEATEKQLIRTENCQVAYMNLLKECVVETKNDSVQKVLTSLEGFEGPLPEEMVDGDIIMFRTEIGEFPHNEKDVQKFWAFKCLPEAGKKEKKMCIMCGQDSIPIERHSMSFSVGRDRTKLISANESAYLSYGLKASLVAPTCFLCEQKYGQALTYLLQKYSDRTKSGGKHTFQAGGVNYLYWTTSGKEFNFNEFMTNPQPEAVEKLLKTPFTGQQIDVKDFFIMVVTPNKGRLVVRDYIESSTSKIEERNKVFFNAQDIGSNRFYSIYSLAAAMFRDPNKEMQPYVIQEWVKWAVEGYPLSGRIVQGTLKRIQVAEHGMNRLHAAVIKSWLVSNSEKSKEEWTVRLDESRDTAPYLCGRLFAVLEKVQEEAIKGNETIANRFFGTASTAPRSLFGLLIRNSQAHLSKLRKENKSRYIYFSEEIQVITEHLPEFPSVLRLDEQAEFGLGYYHQRQKFFKPKSLKEGETLV